MEFSAIGMKRILRMTSKTRMIGTIAGDPDIHLYDFHLGLLFEPPPQLTIDGEELTILGTVPIPIATTIPFPKLIQYVQKPQFPALQWQPNILII